MIILLCQNTTVVGHTVSQPSRDLKELYWGRTHKYENNSPEILVSIYSAKCEKAFIRLREAPFKKSPQAFGHCPFGGGGLTPCPDGLGQLFLEEFPSFWGGLDPCPDGLGHFFPRWSAPECPFECGGCNRYLGNAQIGSVSIWGFPYKVE